MNRSNLTITSLLAFALAAGAGHLLRDSLSETATQSPPPPPPSPPQPSLPENHTFQQLASTLDSTTGSKSFIEQFHAVGDDFRRRRLILLRWAEVDPTSALDFLVKLPDETGHNSWYIRALFNTWAITDPASAFANCTAFTSASDQHSAVRAALDGAATVDPDRAFALFFATKQTLPPAIGHLSRGWIYDNPGITLTQIQKHDPGSKWSRVVRAGVAAAWARSEPAAATAWVNSNLGSFGPADIDEFTMALNVADNARASEFFTSLPQNLRSPRAAGAIASVIAKDDPAKALIWIDENTLGLPKQKAITAMLDNVAVEDPATAALYVEELPASGRSTRSIVTRMMKTWTRTAPDEARAWIGSLDPGSLKNQATRQFATSWHQHDRETVIKFIHDNPPEVITGDFLRGILDDDYAWDKRLPEKVALANSLPEHYAAQLAVPIASLRSYIDPAAAAEAAILFESPAARRAAANSVISGALADKRETFATWLAAQPDPATHTLFLDALKNPKLNQGRAQETLNLYQAAKAAN